MAPRTASEERHAIQSELEKRRSGPSMLSFHDGKLLKRSAVMATDRLDMASTLPARSAILPRSTSMSGGAIAGAVVGSVIAATLIFLCFLPFILRAIRQRAARRRHGDLAGPEMAIGPDLGGYPGYGLAPPPQPDSSRRLSREHFASVISPVQTFVPRPVKEFVVDASAGFAFRDEDSQSPTGTATTQVTQSPIAPAQPDLSTVGGPVTTSPVQDGGVPLEPAAGRADGPVDPTQPGPEAGDMVMAATSELSHAARHHRFHVGVPSAMKHIAAALRRSSTRSSGDPQIEPPTRSPTLDQGQYLSSTVSAPPIFESYGDDPRGASYSYYHDPDILNESPASTSPVQQTPVSYPPPPGASAMYNMNFMSAPAAMPSTAGAELSAPSSPEYGSPEYTHFPQGRVSPMRISSPDVKQEPSPEDESTVSPGTPIAREADVANALLARGRVQELKMEAADGESAAQTAAPFRRVMRMDTLPISGITADSPTTDQGADLPAPAGINPMDIMAPSNDAEMTHRVKHELDVIANSPPPQVFTATVVEPSDPVSDSSPEQISDDGEDGRDIDMLDISDYSTPPTFSHSSGPSVQNTPDTRVSYTSTASPSPRPPHDDGELANGDNPGNSSPHAFQCEKCGRQFDQIHKLNHHRRYHERPHECPHRDCGMRFGTKTHLARHINDKHEKKRKYFCMVTDCPYSRQGGKSFPRKDNWRRHMQNKHQITPETDPGAEYVDEVMGGA